MSTVQPDTQDIDQTPGVRNAKIVDNTVFPKALKRIELHALRQVTDSQICRLLQLANLLDVPSPVDRPAEVLTQLAEDIRQATTTLEEAIHGIADLNGNC